jgi:hypothetical protein
MYTVSHLRRLSPLRERQMNQGSSWTIAAHPVREIALSCRVVLLWRRLSIASLRYFVSRIFLWKTLCAWRLLYAFLRVSLSNCNKMGLQHGYVYVFNKASWCSQITHAMDTQQSCARRTHAIGLLVRGTMFHQWWIPFSGMWHLVSRYAVTIVFGGDLSILLSSSPYGPLRAWSLLGTVFMAVGGNNQNVCSQIYIWAIQGDFYRFH